MTDPAPKAAPTPAPAPAAKPVARPVDESRMVRFSALPEGGPRCPACGSDRITHVSAYPSDEPLFRMAVVFWCGGCGSGHVPDADRLLGDYYTVDYATQNRRDRGIDPESYFTGPPESVTMERYFRRAESQVAALREHGAVFDRVLDFGSGPGYFLHSCDARARFAVELDEASAKYLDWLGATRLDGEALGRGVFDVILASHVVEHLTAESLAPTLDRLFAALRPGGRMLIEVPQGGHSYMKLLNRQDPHTLFFTPEGLLRAVERPDVVLLAAYQRAPGKGAVHPQAIYAPKGDAFRTGRGGGLTVILSRQA